MEAKKLSDLEDEFHEAASEETGYSNFGESDYREGMRALLHAFDNELHLSESGFDFVSNFYFRGPLAARLYSEKGWMEHPEVLSQPIARPIIIVGLVRSGTTALHKLLSMDPEMQGLDYWLAQRPIVRPSSGNMETIPAYRAGDTTVRMIHAHMPQLAKAHDYVTSDVEACKMGLCQSFMRTELTALLPSYGRWHFAQDRRSSFRRYADVLRLIGSGAPSQRWLLKDAHHLFELDALLDVFPDACIVHTHRDPLKVIPSICSLWHTVEKALHGEAAKPETIGPREIPFWRRGLELAEAERRKRPMQFHDVDHRAFSADPLGTVRTLYAKLDIPLTEVAEERMRAWIAASPTTKHGPHEYRIEDWGISPEQIREGFEEYRKQYNFN